MHLKEQLHICILFNLEQSLLSPKHLLNSSAAHLGMMGPRIIFLLACLFSSGTETHQSRVMILDGDACSSGDIPITFLKCNLKDVASCITRAPQCSVVTVLIGMFTFENCS
jgi:hypothetical protein